MFSAIRSMKTEKARRTVNPRATFSPLSGGRQKLVNVKAERSIHGIITLKK